MKKQCILLHLRWLPLIALLFFTRASFGQGPTVSGKVTDSTGKALAGSAIGYAMDGFDLLILGFMLPAISAELRACAMGAIARQAQRARVRSGKSFWGM